MTIEHLNEDLRDMVRSYVGKERRFTKMKERGQQIGDKFASFDLGEVRYTALIILMFLEG
jgi:hypothetical protein